MGFRSTMSLLFFLLRSLLSQFLVPDLKFHTLLEWRCSTVAMPLGLSDADHSEVKGETAILIQQNPSFQSLLSSALKFQ